MHVHKLCGVALPGDFITSAEAAALLGVDRSTITRWVQLGRLIEAHQFPGATGTRLFHRADVVALAAELKASA